MAPESDKTVRHWSGEPVTLALSHYDRHAPLVEGAVTIPGIPLKVMVVGQSESGPYGSHRHARMLNNEEFDIAEVSLSSYLMAKDQGAPFTAIPIFPRRLFSMSQMWVRKDSGISTPTDLPGKRVGLSTFQTTLSVLAKADLERSYKVPWRDIVWVTAREETRAFAPHSSVKLERLAAGESLLDAITAGTIDSVMIPHPSRAFLQNSQLVRLLKDPVAEESRYFREFGYFPIMHTIVFRNEVLQRSPGLAQAAFEAFQQSWRIANERWDDPNWSFLAWGRQAVEKQRKVLGEDIWPNGLEKNLTNLTWFIQQSYDQGLIGKPFPPSELFHPSVLEV
ncbi:MAG: ABC transporter substrate-binding protein [Acidimicrobiaceae bacterium]|nr:ABC transporter substrate-binding protein [Acidimicrobiaceae bacterium]